MGGPRRAWLAKVACVEATTSLARGRISRSTGFRPGTFIAQSQSFGSDRK